MGSVYPAVTLHSRNRLPALSCPPRRRAARRLIVRAPPGYPMVTAEIWPTLDYSRVPYRLYHDVEVYKQEQERIFKGPTWNYLCLDSEIPRPGDFRASYVGDCPVIVSRDENG